MHAWRAPAASGHAIANTNTTSQCFPPPTPPARTTHTRFSVLGIPSEASFDLFEGLSGERVVSVAMGSDSLAAIARSGGGGALVAYLVDGLGVSPAVLKCQDTGLPPGCAAPSCLGVLDGCQTGHGRAEALVGSPSARMVVLDYQAGRDGGDVVQEVELSEVPVAIAIAPYHRGGSKSLIATFGEGGTLCVWPADFSALLLEYKTRASELPSMSWCGSTGGVALGWRGRGSGRGSSSSDAGSGGEEGALEPCMVHLVDSKGEVHEAEFEGEEGIVLVSEVDGVRVIGETRHLLLQRVPSALTDAQGFGTSHPAALLEGAYSDFCESRASCYDTIRDLLADGEDGGGGGSGGSGGSGSGSGGAREPPALVRAVEGCIASALHSWEGATQIQFLSAASYGKAFALGDGAEFRGGGEEEGEGGEGAAAGGEGGGGGGGGGGEASSGAGGGEGGRLRRSGIAMSRDRVPDACKKLRVLNCLRDASCGMPLSIDQFEELSPRVIVERLLARHKHGLAYGVSELLGLPACKDRALTDWACEKVRSSKRMEDEALAALITRRLAKVATVSYADIASAADAAGRRVLATLLLNLEAKVGDKVPTLLRMKERRLALEKALESGDSNWVYLVLFALREACRREGMEAAGLGGGGRALRAGAGAGAGARARARAARTASTAARGMLPL